MPKSTVVNTLTSSTKTANLIQGNVNEFVSYDAIVRITGVVSATGVNLSVFADSDLLMDDQPVPYIGSSLIDKDHTIDEFEVEAGTRLAIFARETAGSVGTIAKLGIEITPA